MSKLNAEGGRAREGRDAGDGEREVGGAGEQAEEVS